MAEQPAVGDDRLPEASRPPEVPVLDDFNEIVQYKANSRWYSRAGHFYVASRSRGVSTTMRCATDGCPVHWTLRDGRAGPTTGLHNHEPTPWVVNRNIMFQALKKRVSEENIPLNTIYEEEAARYPDAAPHLVYESVLPSMRKWRRRSQPAQTRSMEEFPTNEDMSRKRINGIGIDNINTKHKTWHICSFNFDETCIKREDAVPSLGVVETRDEISNICCCCMAEGEHENDFGTVYIEMFKNCLNMKLGECESAVICSACVGFLREVEQFRETVADTQARLGNVSHDHLFMERTQGRSFLTKDNIKIETVNIEDADVRESCSEESATDSETEFKTELQYDTEYLCDWETLKDFQDADQQRTQNLTEQSDIEIEDGEFKMKTRREARAAKLKMKAKELEQKTKILENLSTILKNSTIVPFATYKNLSNRYDCIYCDENFTSIEILRNHIDTHNDEEQKLEALKSVQELILRADVSCIRCKICQLRLNTLDELVQHLTKLHNIQYHDIPSNPPHNILPFDLTAEVLKCLVCDKVLKKYKPLLRHMNLHYGTHLCPNCGETFIYLNNFKRHKRFEQFVKTKRESMNVSLNEVHACPVCFRRFKLKCKMLAHLKKGHHKKQRSSEKTQCGICLKTLFCRNLRRHVKNKHPEDNGNAKLLPSATKNVRLKCSICRKKFASARGLQKHIKETHRETETELCQENIPSIEGTSDATLVRIPIKALNMMELPINDRKCIIIPYDNTNEMEISFDTAAEIEIESIESD